jgi:hypothetical protein
MSGVDSAFGSDPGPGESEDVSPPRREARPENAAQKCSLSGTAGAASRFSFLPIAATTLSHLKLGGSVGFS